MAAMKAAGYDGIELCGFMIHPIGFAAAADQGGGYARQGRAASTGTLWSKKRL
ncbi:MAG: hypothetical protein ACLR5F_13305 [Faecalibacterium sp.]